MPRKQRFKPEITRVKLNPEQAVLTCNCYNYGFKWLGEAKQDIGGSAGTAFCNSGRGYPTTHHGCFYGFGHFHVYNHQARTASS